jgi:hypothetical protein
MLITAASLPPFLCSIVASYPFIPLTGAIAASAAKLYHQQQHKQQLRQQLQQQLPLHEDEQQQEDEDDVNPNTAAAAEEHVFALAAEATTEAVQDVLHSREQRVLQQRRQLLGSQLQQWWDQLQALGLAEF